MWRHYHKQGRHDLPWRKTHNPYRILVSEVMLQQTQVERVVPYYQAFLKKFPTAKRLADAPLSSILIAWQGLGYNRRAKMLANAAKIIVREYGSVFPKDPHELQKLPGVGSYTAGAVAAFAWNQDVIFIETNIRTAVIHHFFSKPSQKTATENCIIYDTVSDSQVSAILARLLPKKKAREWYYALMDYGAYLKRSGVRINARVKGYTKQSRFLGSTREARGTILRELSKGARSKTRLLALLGDDRTDQLKEQIDRLVAERLIEKRNRCYVLPH